MTISATKPTKSYRKTITYVKVKTTTHTHVYNKPTSTTTKTSSTTTSSTSTLTTQISSRTTTATNEATTSSDIENSSTDTSTGLETETSTSGETTTSDGETIVGNTTGTTTAYVSVETSVDVEDTSTSSLIETSTASDEATSTTAESTINVEETSTSSIAETTSNVEETTGTDIATTTSAEEISTTDGVTTTDAEETSTSSSVDTTNEEESISTTADNTTTTESTTSDEESTSTLVESTTASEETSTPSVDTTTNTEETTTSLAESTTDADGTSTSSPVETTTDVDETSSTTATTTDADTTSVEVETPTTSEQETSTTASEEDPITTQIITIFSPSPETTTSPSASPDLTSSQSLEPTTSPTPDATSSPTTDPTTSPTPDVTTGPTTDLATSPTAEQPIEPTTSPTLEPTTSPVPDATSPTTTVTSTTTVVRPPTPVPGVPFGYVLVESPSNIPANFTATTQMSRTVAMPSFSEVTCANNCGVNVPFYCVFYNIFQETNVQTGVTTNFCRMFPTIPTADLPPNAAVQWQNSQRWRKLTAEEWGTPEGYEKWGNSPTDTIPPSVGGYVIQSTTVNPYNVQTCANLCSANDACIYFNIFVQYNKNTGAVSGRLCRLYQRTPEGNQVAPQTAAYTDSVRFRKVGAQEPPVTTTTTTTPAPSPSPTAPAGFNRMGGDSTTIAGDLRRIELTELSAYDWNECGRRCENSPLPCVSANLYEVTTGSVTSAMCALYDTHIYDTDVQPPAGSTYSNSLRFDRVGRGIGSFDGATCFANPTCWTQLVGGWQTVNAAAGTAWFRGDLANARPRSSTFAVLGSYSGATNAPGGIRQRNNMGNLIPGAKYRLSLWHSCAYTTPEWAAQINFQPFWNGQPVVPIVYPGYHEGWKQYIWEVTATGQDMIMINGGGYPWLSMIDDVELFPVSV
ncbi:hypothetical protein HK097_008127 [Rhizophlyctis rosea]|uniref:Uncharacterized protein n=1 Tax=Rhizophlyctis rosea TaxID=64517 RepID=A0AAD5SJB0_9FUNG|nr:hypothetical protein HK097_008127 [Rhizophlyctis rosea]